MPVPTALVSRMLRTNSWRARLVASPFTNAKQRPRA